MLINILTSGTFLTHLIVSEVADSTELHNWQVRLVAKEGACLLGQVCPNREEPGLLSGADEAAWLSGGGAALVAEDVLAAGQDEAKARVWSPTAPFQ